MVLIVELRNTVGEVTNDIDIPPSFGMRPRKAGESLREIIHIDDSHVTSGSRGAVLFRTFLSWADQVMSTTCYATYSFSEDDGETKIYLSFRTNVGGS
jgi:hypothetical protein